MDIRPLPTWLALQPPTTSADWLPLSAQPLLILVGLTGVGKTTTVNALRARRPDLRLLPNRRELTDWLIIPEVQRRAGEAERPLTDRTARFAATSRYREFFPGGMAHALSQLAISQASASAVLLFDGLRGAAEISHAVTLLPHARFLLLEAPHAVRVTRLVKRQDTFDQVANSAAHTLFTPEDDFYSSEEKRMLQQLVEDGVVSASELRAKLRIVATERQHYDPAAARAAALRLAPTRTHVFDTVALTPDAIAERLARIM